MLLACISRWFCLCFLTFDLFKSLTLAVLIVPIAKTRPNINVRSSTETQHTLKILYLEHENSLYSMKTCRHLVHRCTDNYDPVLSPPPEFLSSLYLFVFSSTHSLRAHVLAQFASHINYITHFSHVRLSCITFVELLSLSVFICPLLWSFQRK